MAGRDIVINIVAKTKDAVKGFRDVDEAGGKMASGLKGRVSGALGTLGDTMSGVTSKMGGAGGAIGGLGDQLGDLVNPTAAAGAAVAGFAAFVAGGVSKLGEMVAEVRNFKGAAGTTWEESSRLVAVMDDLGVSADEGAGAMAKLAKGIAANPEALAKFGVEIARTADGSVDMVKTLQNVASVFASIKDPAARAALGTAAFGKSWATLVPILEQGGGALGEAVAGVKDYQIVSEESAAAQREMEMAVDDLQDAVSGLQMALAKDLVPALADSASDLAKVIDFVNKATVKVGGLEGVLGALPGGQARQMVNVFRELVGAGDDASESTKDLAKSSEGLAAQSGLTAAALEASEEQERRLALSAKDAGKAYQDFTKDTRDALAAQEQYRDALRDVDGSLVSLERAQIRAGDASQELTRDALAAAEAERVHGGSSQAAATAAEVYRRSQLDAKDALLGSAGAAVQTAEKTASAGGQALTAAERTKVYRDELVRMRDGVSDPQLQVWLDELIRKHHESASAAQSAAANLHGYNQALNDLAGIEREFRGPTGNTTGARVTFRAKGGAVAAGQPFIAGEGGHPELIVPKEDMHVFNPSQTRSMLSGGGGGSAGVAGGTTVVLNGVIAGSEQQLAAYLSRVLRTYNVGRR